MAKTFLLSILTPEHEFYRGQVEMLNVSALDGELCILAGHGLCANFVQTGRDILHCGQETVNSGCILRTCLKFIRQFLRLRFLIGTAAGTAGNQRQHPMRKCLPHQHGAHTLRPQQPFVSGQNQRAGMRCALPAKWRIMWCLCRMGSSRRRGNRAM